MQEKEELDLDAELVVTSFISVEPFTDCEEHYDVKGSVTIAGAGVGPVPFIEAVAYQVLGWDLEGVDGRCAAGPNKSAVNSCGVHIHDLSGTPTPDHPCSQAFGNDSFAIDPDAWRQITYTPKSGEDDCARSRARGVRVTTGWEVPDLINKVVLIHDKAGSPIACGAIEPPSLVAYITPAPGYEGRLKVSGAVRVRGEGQGNRGAKQVLSWDLHGADPRCAGGEPHDMSCHIIIYTGTCADLDEPFPNLPPDYQLVREPWKDIIYVGSEAFASLLRR